jgi:hypothetical protein
MRRTSQNPGLAAGIRLAIAALMKELRRLNNARMDPSAFAGLPRRNRSRTVKKALAEHHRNPNRCC